MKTVILINVGTPNSPEPRDVGVYLREFLMDPNIIPMPRPFRDILVKGLIVPKRKFTSAQKYKSIWTDEGSPLMVESLNLQDSLQTVLGKKWKVRLGMQVGNPSLKDAVFEASKESSKIFVVPLYPQFAKATTGGALQVVQGLVPVEGAVEIINPFYKQDWFLKAQTARIREHLRPQDHLLLSYHGLPVSQLKQHRPACYQSARCCEVESACAQNCYKAQCLKTSDLLKKELGLEKISIGFQSRLGRAQWIEPSTTDVTLDLAKQGVKHLKVACPSFVADCLETLEEIGMELRHEFLKAGGESFELIPCVNSHEIFVRGLAQVLVHGPALDSV
jgi:protoporphyrin/coproporphyrin ferrochelatase